MPLAGTGLEMASTSFFIANQASAFWALAEANNTQAKRDIQTGVKQKPRASLQKRGAFLGLFGGQSYVNTGIIPLGLLYKWP